MHVTAEVRASFLVCMLAAVLRAGLGGGGQGSVREVRQAVAHWTQSLERLLLTALMELENGIGHAHASESLLYTTDLLKHHSRNVWDAETALL